jgi:hypothetical protein
MFGRSKPVVFDPYRGRRGRRGLPGWLWSLIAGLAIGAAGVVWAQQRWLPPRLSATESTQLRERFAQADADRSRLQTELAAAARQSEQTRTERDMAQQERDALAARVSAFDADLDFLVDALPPDPRGGPVAVRAARFEVRQGALRFRLALSHERAGGRPLDAQLRVSVTGVSGRGADTRVDLPPTDLSIAPQHVTNGELPLPAGFTPRQAAVRLVDRAGATLGQRTLLIR